MTFAAGPIGIGGPPVSPTATGANFAAGRMLRPPKMSLRPCEASSTHVGFFVFLQARRQPVNFQPLYGFALRTTRGLFNRKLAARHEASVQRAVGWPTEPLVALTLPHPLIPIPTEPLND